MQHGSNNLESRSSLFEFIRVCSARVGRSVEWGFHNLALQRYNRSCLQSSAAKAGPPRTSNTGDRRSERSESERPELQHYIFLRCSRQSHWGRPRRAEPFVCVQFTQPPDVGTPSRKRNDNLYVSG